MNREICGQLDRSECYHYDVALTRSEILSMLDDIKIKNPNYIPAILGAIKKTYRINLSYQ